MSTITRRVLKTSAIIVAVGAIGFALHLLIGALRAMHS